MNVGKSRVEAADCIDPQSVPLTGYKHFLQKVQVYPVTVQPTVPEISSTLLDLPNVQMNLPLPLTPQQPNLSLKDTVNRMPQTTSGQGRTLTANEVVSNGAILESIQNIMKVMQQQITFNSKTAEQGIIQMASLFQEMIKSQEKRDLDPAVLAIPMFLGESAYRSKC